MSCVASIPNDIVTPEPGMKVKKWGRTTGLTRGIIESRQLRMSLPYHSSNFKALCWFTDVWFIESTPKSSFALGGDSGSLVVTDDGAKAVGVIFAATTDGSYGIMIPIKDAMALFGGFSLISNHGICPCLFRKPQTCS